LGVFIILDVTKFFTNVLAKPAYAFWLFVYEYGWIAITILIIVLIVIIIYFPQLLVSFRKWIKKRREDSEKEKESTNRKALDVLVKGAVKD
jgi:hypothetical protein